jgi:hypothetical protein
MNLTIELNDEETGDDVAHDLPAKFEVCPTCEGKGSHVNPSIDSHGISREEFDADPEFEEAYFAGRYDVTCHECKGQRVVLVVDESKLNASQKDLYAEWQEQEACHARWDREDAMTRRMESGGY